MNRTIFHVPRRLLQVLIRAYQKTISPDHGWISGLFRYPACRYHPTCSQYAHDAVGKYGIFKGGVMAIWRVLRCNPWSRGGHDPVR